MNEPLRAEKAPAAQHTLRLENCETLVATGIEAICRTTPWARC